MTQTPCLKTGFAATMMSMLGVDLPQKMALAVSGGGDSMALLYLAADWARLWQVDLSVVTIDHQLRRESGAEAALVKAVSQDLGLTHTTLLWQIVIACGTAAHAGMVAKYAIEHWTHLPVDVEVASEFRYRDPIVGPDSLVIAISQSGETMDTLMALRYAKSQGARTLAICNTVGSTIPRESDAVIYTYAGPEIAVASTKAFLTQITATFLVGLFLAQVRGTMFEDEIRGILADLDDMPRQVDLVLDTAEPIRELARSLASARSVLFLGRHVGYPVALEGALKLKELAYMHAEGFPAGELKHGPIALIEEGIPVIVIVPSPKGRAVLHDKIVSNIQEVRARGARVIAIAEEGDESIVTFADHIIRIPAVPTLMQPLVAVVPLQIFACEMATGKGHDVDQPRNLAKSVTVE